MERPSHETDIFSIVRKNPESVIAAAGSAEDELLNFKKRFETSIFESAFSDSNLAQRALTKAEAELFDMKKRLADLHHPQRRGGSGKIPEKDPVNRRKLLQRLAVGAAAVGAASILYGFKDKMPVVPKVDTRLIDEKVENARSLYKRGAAQEAVNQLNDIINSYPDNVGALLLRGTIFASGKITSFPDKYRSRGARVAIFEIATLDFDRALKIKPDCFQARSNKAIAMYQYFSTGSSVQKPDLRIMFRVVEGGLSAAIEQSPNTAELYGNLAWVISRKEAYGINSDRQNMEDKQKIESLLKSAREKGIKVSNEPFYFLSLTPPYN